MLKNDKKILNLYGNGNEFMQKIWVHFYYYYIQNTLNPYRIVIDE
jgi:hypothetical protein